MLLEVSDSFPGPSDTWFFLSVFKVRSVFLLGVLRSIILSGLSLSLDLLLSFYFFCELFLPDYYVYNGLT